MWSKPEKEDLENSQHSLYNYTSHCISDIHKHSEYKYSSVVVGARSVMLIVLGSENTAARVQILD